MEIFESLSGLDTPSVTQRGGPPHIHNSTPLLQNHAIAACAWNFLRAHFVTEHGGSLHAAQDAAFVQNAAFCADTLAARGFVPRVCIRVAAWLDTLRTCYGLDARTMPDFAGLPCMWRAYDGYRVWCARRETAREEKVRGREHEYGCAAPGCGIQATHRRALRRCGGRCPQESKPRYCSKSCQTKVSRCLIL